MGAGINVLLGIVIFIFLGTAIAIYNSLVRLKNNIEKAWSNIDVLLKQRYDELPNLVNVVKEYVKHEKSLMTMVTKARTAFMSASNVPDKARADNVMKATLKSIFAVAENYPKLRADENFLKLQQRISEIEDMIADRREFYNDSVTTFNTRIEQIPYMFLARLLKYTKKELFKAEEEARSKATYL